MKNETAFIRAIHRLLPPKLFIWKICDPYAGGVPDAFYTGQRGSLWAEYKYLKDLPKRPNTVVKTGVSPLQQQWLTNMHNLGHNVALIVGWSQNVTIMTNNQWNEHLPVTWFEANKKSKKQVASWIETQCYAEQECTSASSSPKPS